MTFDGWLKEHRLDEDTVPSRDAWNAADLEAVNILRNEQRVLLRHKLAANAGMVSALAEKIESLKS